MRYVLSKHRSTSTLKSLTDTINKSNKEMVSYEQKYEAAIHSNAMDPSLTDKERKKIHDSHFYSHQEPTIPDDFAELLEAHSGLPRGSEQLTHIMSLRDRAYEAHHYPCLGLYRFLILALSRHPLYHSYVLPLLTEASSKPSSSDPEPIFLDFGCCLGQDLRKLIYDDVSPSLLYGSDILPDFIPLGYELFRDEARFPLSHFLTPADGFDPSSSNVLSALNGKCDIVHASAVFHLFNYQDQLILAKRVFKLLRPPSEGRKSLIMGQQNGNKIPKEYPSRPGHRSDTLFRHNEESWAGLWEEVGRTLQPEPVKLKVKTELFPHRRPEGVEKPNSGQWVDEGFSWMRFEIWWK